MKTKKRVKKDFDSVAFFRKIKEDISKKMSGKSFVEQKKLLKELQTSKSK